jgi:hypothetical protein
MHARLPSLNFEAFSTLKAAALHTVQPQCPHPRALPAPSALTLILSLAAIADYLGMTPAIALANRPIPCGSSSHAATASIMPASHKLPATTLLMKPTPMQRSPVPCLPLVGRRLSPLRRGRPPRLSRPPPQPPPPYPLPPTLLHPHTPVTQTPPSPILPSPEPDHPRRNTYCPFSGFVPCTTRLPTPQHALDHIRSHHRTTALLCPPTRPPDLSPCGLAICTDCTNVFLSGSFDDHAATCQYRLRRLSALAGHTFPLLPLPSTLATVAANLWPTGTSATLPSNHPLLTGCQPCTPQLTDSPMITTAALSLAPDPKRFALDVDDGEMPNHDEPSAPDQPTTIAPPSSGQLLEMVPPMSLRP